MAVQITTDGPLAKALQAVLNPKLVELGWSSGLQDDSLTEYIILMLVNGKTQDDISNELARDLLALNPEDLSAVEFATWLFEQVDILNTQINGTAVAQPEPVVSMEQDMQVDDITTDFGTPEPAQKAIPTGPKAMRNGSAKPTPNRMFNQINRQMDRTADPLHRVHTPQGVGRVNSHSRGGMRGTKGQQIQRNFEGMNRRAQQGPMGPQGAMGGQGQQGFGYAQNSQAQLLQMFEQQAQMMAQLAAQSGLMPQAFTPQGPAFGSRPFNQNQNQSNGKSLFERVGGSGRGRGRNQNHNHSNRQSSALPEDATMGDDVTSQHSEQPASSPSKTMCKYNLFCTKADCAFVHQSPAAPQGTLIDMDSECTFGAACKNHKCVARHPSPAKKFEHQKTQDCKFGPFCSNPACPFKHTGKPAGKPCRKGGDCDTPGCTFYHTTTLCKYTPCTNVQCTFKHREGQKGTALTGNVWKAGEEGQHISERRFVDDEAVEEVIIPGAAAQEVNTGEAVVG